MIPNNPVHKFTPIRGGKQAHTNPESPRRKGLFTECCRRSLVGSVLRARVHREVEGALGGAGRGGLGPGLLHQKCGLSGDREEVSHRAVRDSFHTGVTSLISSLQVPTPEVLSPTDGTSRFGQGLEIFLEQGCSTPSTSAETLNQPSLKVQL